MTAASSGNARPAFRGGLMKPELRAFLDRVIVPALLERFLREQAGRQQRQASARGAVGRDR